MANQNPLWAGVPYAEDTTMAQAAPSIWASTPPSMPAPEMPQVVQAPKMDLHKDLPPVFAPTPEPTMMPTPGQKQIEADQSALSADREKDANPWGTSNNHPGIGGKIAHVLSKIGNIAGDVVAPSVMENIPGTDINRKVEEGQLAKRLNAEITDESNNQYRTAETGKTNEETEEMPQKASDTHDVSGATAANLESETRDRDAAAQNPPLATAYAHAVNDAIKRGVDPSTDPIVQHLSDAIVSLQPGQNKAPEAPKTITAERPGFKGPHEFAWNPKTGAYDIDEGQHYERPVNVNVGVAGDRKLQGDALKLYQPAMDAAERANVMAQNYEDAVKNHDQQAMLSLLTNHIGMTLGAQKGARITKDVLHEAEASRPWLQGIGTRFDKDGVLSGVTLSPGQMRQMVDLGYQKYGEENNKASNEAKYIGVDNGGPERTPSPATIRYYTAKANGDPAKAKALAAQNGWTVK